MTETLDKKVLVIDDTERIRTSFVDLGGDQFVAPETFAEVERELRETKYALILMDGYLEGFSYRDIQRMEQVLGEELHGKYLVRAIRSGEYGAVAQETPIASISSVTFPELELKFNKERYIEDTVQKIKETYLK